jgi:hypothetical protein
MGSDLFNWREEADAAERVAQAEAERAAAERARRYAPHGKVRTRQARLEAATMAALQAELRLARIQGEQP